MRKLSLPVRLALLVAGSTLPLIIFVSAVIYRGYEKDRDDAAARVLETARSLRIVLDAEMQRITGSLHVLSLTNSLRSGDFDRFRRIADGFLAQYPPGGSMIIADRNGKQLFSTATTDTSSLPPRNNMDVVRKVFESGKPVFSNIFIGSGINRQILTVEIPVIVDGQVIYDISFVPPTAMFQTMIEKQRPNAEWALSIFDSEGTNFARVPNPQETVGKKASPTLLAEMFKSNEATFQTISLEGVPLITAVARSSMSGWLVASGIPNSSLVLPLLRNLAITIAIGVLLMLVGVAFALRMASTIARGETLQALLVEELNHRVKNTLAVLQAIASQTFRTATRNERETFDGRLGALARAHDLLSQEKWVGAGVHDVVNRVLEPYSILGTPRVAISGPKLPLTPARAVMMSMILHEIATNAAKYGALSNDSGKIAIDWNLLPDSSEAKLQMSWVESGGPRVSAPTRKGFGSKLIERGARDQLGGSATADFLPAGVVYTIECALA
ncbi:HWE histidine kinase domain-containing protein [Tardiphaga sp.]|uniref:HWE histidine kinase domain-containing protein n=1 Tax=Tardiphaga sp. TaxID=1926292 RepID=UPI0037D9FD1A